MYVATWSVNFIYPQVIAKNYNKMSYCDHNCVFSCLVAIEVVDNVDTSINDDAKENFAITPFHPNTAPVEEEYGRNHRKISLINAPVYHSDGHNFRKFTYSVIIIKYIACMYICTYIAMHVLIFELNYHLISGDF